MPEASSFAERCRAQGGVVSHGLGADIRRRYIVVR